MRSFKVEIYADMVCPWCYVGKRKIESALDYYRQTYIGEKQPEIQWKPFLLHAAIPDEGLDRKEYLKHRFPGNANSPEMFARVEKAGREVGLDYRFDLILRQSNTVDAHRLIRYAHGHGVVDPVVEGLFKAFFTHGEDVSSPDVLAGIAARAGLNASEVKNFLAGEEEVEWVKAEDARAKRRRGVTVAPFIVLNERKGFSAVQSVESIFRALEWARRDAARPKWWPSFLTGR